MPRLEQVLTKASARQAREIVIEPGQAIRLGGNGRDDTLSDVLAEDELFDALAEVLGPDQQADLAVGNSVSFQLDVDGNRWSMVTEPRPSGLILRGLGAASGGPTKPASIEILTTGLDDDDEDDMPPPVAGSRWGLGGAASTGAGVRLDSGPQASAAVADDDVDFDLDLGEGEGLSLPDPRSVSASGLQLEEPGPPAPSPSGDETSFADFGSDDAISIGDLGSEPVATPEPAPRAAPVSPPMPPMGTGGMAPTVQQMAAASAVPASSARAAPGRPATANLGGHANLVEPGGLAFVQGIGLAEQVAGVLAVPCHVVDGAVLPEWTHLEHGSLVAVRCEDPSAHLGWILRRLEEGVRVIVETRASGPEGARRILLGTDASARAEAWLDQVPMRWFARGPSGWTAL